MNDLPIQALGNNELTEFVLRQMQKRAAARKLKHANLRLAHQMLAEAAQRVLDNWSSGDLAGAVRDLDEALTVYKQVRK